ncbi:MAG TPA: hypothetical protein PLW93_02335 [Candidatus Absconditabacterales bacterium]|nr:hypothetical protein [Candidatus Absconditabacterales bacterium]HNG97086.1 hypothetical protein [Candidatus Absconditabacterales bacterium]
MTVIAIEDVKNLLREKQCSINGDEIQKRLYSYLSITLEGVSYYIEELLSGNKQIHIAKSLCFELRTLRAIRKKINSGSISQFDKAFPNLIHFRNCIAHLEERIEEKIIIKNAQNGNIPVNTNFGTSELYAGGLLKYLGEGSRELGNSDSSLTNCEFDGSKGLYTCFGIINDYILIPSDNDLIELEITSEKRELLKKGLINL